MTDQCQWQSRQRVASSVTTAAATAIYLVCAIAIIATPTNGYFFLRDELMLSSSSSSSINVAFVLNSRIERRRRSPHERRQHHLSMSSENNGNDQNNESDDESSKKDDKLSSSENDTLSWRLAKARLEEANKPHWLKSKPLKLSYATSQKWIQRNWAPTTQEEFEDLVENGNLRTPYISKRPEEYYGERGEWISWDHYLLGDSSSDSGGSVSGNSTEVLKWQ